MIASIRKGVYPTMVTPFTQDNQIDYDAAAQIVEYYAEFGCDGIFALCLSSEIFQLTDKESQNLLRFIVKANKGRMSLVASGHTACDINAQIHQLGNIYECGAQETVLILNRLAMNTQDEDVVRRNAEKIFEALPDVRFGVYECPYPYKRLASIDLIKWFADTGRVRFFKDTCCDLPLIQQRIDVMNGTEMMLFNANSSTLLPSLQAGAAGFCGVMGNFHADLYVMLHKLHATGDHRAELLQAFLSMASLMETRLYPVNAKYHLALMNVNMTLATRCVDQLGWKSVYEDEIKYLYQMEELCRKELGMKLCAVR